MHISAINDDKQNLIDIQNSITIRVQRLMCIEICLVYRLDLSLVGGTSLKGCDFFCQIRNTLYATFLRHCSAATGSCTAHARASAQGKHLRYTGWVLHANPLFVGRAPRGDLNVALVVKQTSNPNASRKTCTPSPGSEVW